MDGENNGNPYFLMDDLGENPTIFGNIQMELQLPYLQLRFRVHHLGTHLICHEQPQAVREAHEALALARAAGDAKAEVFGGSFYCCFLRSSWIWEWPCYCTLPETNIAHENLIFSGKYFLP